MLLKLSPSKLEQFRLFCTDAYNGMITQERMIDDIKGVPFETNAAMELGNAVHAAVEKGHEAFEPQAGGYYQFLEKSAYTPSIDVYAMDKALEWREKIGPCLYEQWESIQIPVVGEHGNYDVQMTLRVDALTPDGVHDHKTSAKSIGKYIDRQNAVNWKVYALKYPGLDVYIWNWLFSKERGEFKYNLKQDYGRHSEVYKLDTTDAERDVMYWLTRMVRFIERQDLTRCISVTKDGLRG